MQKRQKTRCLAVVLVNTDEVNGPTMRHRKWRRATRCQGLAKALPIAANNCKRRTRSARAEYFDDRNRFFLCSLFSSLLIVHDVSFHMRILTCVIKTLPYIFFYHLQRRCCNCVQNKSKRIPSIFFQRPELAVHYWWCDSPTPLWHSRPAPGRHACDEVRHSHGQGTAKVKRNRQVVSLA